MNSHPLSNLRFRTFLGEADYPVITAIINSCKEVDGMNHSTTLEDVRATYTHLVNSDPIRDMLFAEVEGRSVGYTRLVAGGWRWQMARFQRGLRGTRIPAARHRADTARFRRDAAERNLQPTDRIRPAFPTAPRFFDNSFTDKEIAKEALLKRAGYQPIRI